MKNQRAVVPTRQRLELPRGVSGFIWRHGYAEGFRRAMHRHEELELNLVVSGRASYLIDGNRYELVAGSQIWLFPDQDHLLLSDSPDFRMWIAVWKQAIVRRVCRSKESQLLRRRLPPEQWQICTRVGPAATRRLTSLLVELEGETADPSRHAAGLGYLLLSAFGEHRSSDALDPAALAMHPAVRDAASLLRDDPDALAIKLPQLAERCGLSASRLSRLFRAETGIPLVQFRQRMLLERFLTLYNSDRSMKLLPAALTAGFGSYPQFHRVYKRFMNRSPLNHSR